MHDTSPTIRLAIVGADGRMGCRLVALAEQAPDLCVSSRVDQSSGTLDAAVAEGTDVVVDFSVQSQTMNTVAWCERYGVPLVLGTTGLDAADHEALDQLAVRVPTLVSPNFSVGVTALFQLVHEAARLLGHEWDLEVVEAHHRNKVDAPSGTARRLVDRLARARGWSPEAVQRSGRDGLVGARPDQEIAVHAIRGGSVVGDHSVHYLGADESLTISHSARSRDIFVQGALRAARWVARPERAPGRYSMDDVLSYP